MDPKYLSSRPEPFKREVRDFDRRNGKEREKEMTKEQEQRLQGAVETLTALQAEGVSLKMIKNRLSKCIGTKLTSPIVLSIPSVSLVEYREHLGIAERKQSASSE